MIVNSQKINKLCENLKWCKTMFSMQATYETQQSAITQIFWETKQILADNLLGRCCHFTPKYMVLFHKSTGETPPWKWICTSPMQLYYLNKNVKSVTWRNLQIKILRLFLTRYSEINENKWLKIGYLNSFKIMCFPCCLLQI